MDSDTVHDHAKTGMLGDSARTRPRPGCRRTTSDEVALATTALALAQPAQVLGACVRRAGDLTAGVLLFGIVSALHTDPLREPWTGWVARSRGEWLDDLGLTLDQFKRAMRLLRNAGLVASMQRMPPSGGGRVLYARLTNQGEAWARALGLLAPDIATTYDAADHPDVGDAIHDVRRAMDQRRDARGTLRVHRERSRGAGGLRVRCRRIRVRRGSE